MYAHVFPENPSADAIAADLALHGIALHVGGVCADRETGQAPACSETEMAIRKTAVKVFGTERELRKLEAASSLPPSYTLVLGLDTYCIARHKGGACTFFPKDRLVFCHREHPESLGFSIL